MKNQIQKMWLLKNDFFFAKHCKFNYKTDYSEKTEHMPSEKVNCERNVAKHIDQSRNIFGKHFPCKDSQYIYYSVKCCYPQTDI